MNLGRNNLLTTLIDTFFPRRCPGCGVFDVWVCEKCIVAGCEPSIEPWPHTDTLHSPHQITQHVSIGPYNTTILETAMDLYKFHRATELADVFATLLAPGIHQLIADAAAGAPQNPPQSICIIPVPLHPRRIRERGFDQNLLLAQKITDELTQVFGRSTVTCRSDLIIRTRHTAHQTTVAANERVHNLEDAFTLTATAKTLLPHATIIFVDDIVTTGATLNTLAATVSPLQPTAVNAASVLRSATKR